MRDKAAEELDVMDAFVRACRADIDTASIRAGDDPPDIVCQSSEFGDIAFELTRVDDHSFYQGIAKELRGHDGGSSYDEVQPIEDGVRKKLEKYEPDAFARFSRAELLCYRQYLPAWPQDTHDRYSGQIRDHIAPLVAASAFDRIWVFGKSDRTLLLSIP